MSMPKLIKIEEMEPNTWFLMTDKKKQIYANYEKGLLICKHNGKFGKAFFMRMLSADKKKWPSELDTQEMLRITKFKLGG